MRAALLLFPGTNRERDAAAALRRATGLEPRLVFHRETELPPGTDLVVLPGGFSHGDYLRAGAIAARSPVMAAVARHAGRGGLTLGLCNGFQILCEAGLLPGTLRRNAGRRFLSMDWTLTVETADSPFTARWRPGDTLTVPLAHGDGRYEAEEAVLDRLEDEARVAFRYAGGNPNGSARAIAGVLSENRRTLGLMPHPENRTDPLTGGEDGLPLFLAVAESVGAG